MAEVDLGQLHTLLAETLTAAIKDPEVKPATLNVVRQFLKDNNIEVGAVKQGSPIGNLVEALPFEDQDTSEDDAYRH